jgi:hypothetical protein
MTAIALAFSLLVAAVGVLGLVSPSRIRIIQRYFERPAGLYVAAAVRLAMGAAVLLAAPASRAPAVLRIVGVVIIVAGVITAFLGRDRFRGLVAWWSARGSAFVRAWAAVALAFGLLLAYALLP